MIRRSFIQQSTGMLFVLPTIAAEPQPDYLNNIGIQLYSLRKPINENLNQTIDEVARMGYKQVEAYDFPSSKSLDMIKRAKEKGMQVNSSHFQWDSLLNPDPKKLPSFITKWSL